MNTTKFELKGLQQTLQAFKVLSEQIGDKQAQSKVLIPAIKEALSPVLDKAKSDAPVGETGLLSQSFNITGRRPTTKDRRSMYVTATDTVIGLVSSKLIPKKLKEQFRNKNAEVVDEYLQARKGTGSEKESYKKLRKAKRKFYAGQNIAYDGRVVAMEFGTKNVAARPWLRSSLESQATTVAKNLGEIIRENIDNISKKQYKKDWG